MMEPSIQILNVISVYLIVHQSSGSMCKSLQVWVGGYEDEDGSIMWEDGTSAEGYTNFEPNYG